MEKFSLKVRCWLCTTLVVLVMLCAIFFPVGFLFFLIRHISLSFTELFILCIILAGVAATIGTNTLSIADLKKANKEYNQLFGRLRSLIASRGH